MITLDEAISKQREIAETQILLYEACILKEQNTHFLRQADEHKQIAEWLEELKDLREMRDAIESNANTLEQNGYNKAIDDFVKFANTMPTVEADDGTIRPMWLEEMAEQLKEGGENE